MPLYLVNGANTMNLESTTNSASASGPEFESQSYKIRVRDVSLVPNGQTSVRGFSLATLAAALAACGGGGSGGPAAPPPPPPPPPNNAPTATDATGSVAEDGTTATGGSVGSDADGDDLTYSVTANGTHGSLEAAADGSWTYTLTDSADIQALAEGETLTDTATIQVSDGEDTASATVTITITGVNDDPTGDDGAGAVTAGMDMAATGNVNPADVDASDTHTFAVGTAASHGTLTVDEAGAWTYMVDHDNEAVVALAEDATMEDTATIVISDNNGGSAEVTVTITITGVNEAPTAEDGAGAVTAGMDMAATGDVNAMDADVGDTHEFAVGTAATYGTLTVDEAGAWSYALDHANEAVVAMNAGDTVEDTATVMVTDNNGATAEATVTITVTGANDDPTISVMDGVVPNEAMTPANAANDENMGGIPVGEVTITDPDSGQLVSAENAEDAAPIIENIAVDDPRFGIKADAVGGLWLFLNDEMGLDHEDAATVDVTVTFTDDHGATAETVVTITVNNVDEAPDAPTATYEESDLTVAENDGAGVNLAQLTSSDPEGDDISYAVDNEDFEIEVVGNAVLLKVKDGVELDYEATMDGTITLMVTASDGTNTSEATAVVVTVTDINESPTISFDGSDGTETPNGTPAVSTIEENNMGPVGEIVSSDPESGLSGPVTVLTNAEGGYVVTDADGDSLTFTVSDSRFSVKEDPLGGLWLFLNEGVDADMEGGDSITVTVTVSDGVNDPAMTEATITITNVNEAPTIMLMDGKVPDGPGDAVGPYASSTIDENSMGPVAQIDVSDQEDTLTADNVTVDDGRFIIKADHLGGLWLFLNEGVNHEEVGSIDVTVTVTDLGDATAMVEDYTITIRDANDAPTANQVGVTLPDNPATMDVDESATPVTSFDATAGMDFTVTLDLTDMFSDEDGDSLFAYTLKDAPEWLTVLRVEYNDEGQVTGYVLDVKPPAGDDMSAEGVKIVATDQGGASGYAMFNIIVDDGNDVPTAINLTNPDGTDNAFFDLDVDEHATGTMLGYVSVDDQDDPRHSHGQHKWKVDEDNEETFEIVEMNGRQVLKLTDEAMIDFEADGGDSITLTVTATDGRGAAKSQMITVEVNDMNDPVVVANEPGSWWVTINDDLDPEDVAEGALLDFSLETEDDTLPLFTDQDAADASIPDPSDSTMSLMIGKLTYAFVSGAPDWLEIDADTGRIYSKAGEEDDELPTRGVHTITVSATDGAGSSQEATFKLAVVVSDGDNDDNDQTQIESASGMDIDENPEAGTVVATFTITDEDFDLAGLHPWGDVTVAHTAQNTTDSASPVDVSAGWFELEMVSESGDTQNWQVKLTAAGATAMDYENGVEDLRLTISAGDAVTEAADHDTRTINFDVDDVNEAPVYTQDAATSTDLGATPTTAVGQQEVDPTPNDMTDANGVITLYLNLSNMYEDPDEDHDDDDITFTVSTDTPWISVATQPVEWETYMEGPDGDVGGDDDGAWTPTDPINDDDMVAVVTIDRTMMHSQDADGSFTITATDSDGAVTTTMVPVTITDENVAPAADAKGVTLNDDTPYQSDDLRMRFDDSVDPDFTGTEANADNPILVVYEWKRDDDEMADNGDETLLSVSAGEPATYTVTQEDVGMVIQGTVTYFELFGEVIVQTQNMAALDARSELVQDRPDDATGTITFGSTNADDELVATVMVEDADGINAETLTYVWESSVNGRGGWTPFAEDDTADGTATTAIDAAQQGMHVRLVVEFNDNNGTPERVVSETIKVGTIDTITAPTITGFGTGADEGSTAVAVGRTLEVDVMNADVQWMAGGMVVGTGNSFTVTSAQAGMMITAVITSKEADGDVTSLVTTAAVTVAGATAANTSPIVVDEEVVLLGTAPAMAGTLMEYTTTIDTSELFEDVEGGLKFSFAGQDLGTDQYADETLDLDVYLNQDGDQLLIIDETTGEVRYVTTKATQHGDGGNTDGGGNTVDIIVTATDGANTVMNEVSLAIDVPGTYEGTGITDTVTENMATTVDANVGGGINITDLNSPSNEYGQYTWTTDNPGYTATANAMDSSMATVARVAGTKFDGNDDGTNGSVTVTITATPVSGGDAITITLTVTVDNDPNDDVITPTPEPNEVPGLKDNETGSDNDTDDETEDGDDADDDAGKPPEADAMAAFASMLDDGLF